MTARAHTVPVCLTMLLVLAGCMPSQRTVWQCWQQCGREDYPECRVEPGKRLAAKNATHRVAGGTPLSPAQVGRLTLSDDEAGPYPRHCIDERVVCAKLCRGSGDRSPRPDADLE